MFKFLSHFVGLFIKFLDFQFSWSDVSLEFFDLIIQDELELFQFLGFLFQVVNTLILVLDGCFSFFKLSLLRGYLLS